MAITGRITINEIEVLTIDNDPTVAPGVKAPLGSIAIWPSAALIYQKTGLSDIDWIKIAILPIQANEVAYSSNIPFYNNINNIKAALDLIGIEKANLNGGNNFTGNQNIARPNNNQAFINIKPTHTDPNGVAIEIPSSQHYFAIGYNDNANNFVPILGRSPNDSQLYPFMRTNDVVVSSANRVILHQAQNNVTAQINSQGVGIGFDTPDQHTTALLELRSKNKGFLPPRLNETDINNISNPASGLMVWNNSRNTFQFYKGTHWEYTQYFILYAPVSNNTINYVNVPDVNIYGPPFGTLDAGHYEIDGHFIYNISATNAGLGFRLALLNGSTSGLWLLWEYPTGSNGSTTMYTRRTQTALNLNYTTTSTAAGTTNNIIKVSGIFATTLTATPVFQFRASANGVNVTIIRGFVRLTKISG